MTLFDMPCHTVITTRREEAGMTTEPNRAPVHDLSARTDIDHLLATIPVVENLDDFAIPGIFESDKELEDFLAWLSAEQDAPTA